jgi:N-acyl-D-amino-acid deacylase
MHPGPPRRRRSLWWPLASLLLAGLGFWGWRLWLGRFDLVICGGRVFDGTRWLGRGTCVGVRDGKIVRLGFLYGARTRRFLYARGLVISPGFIDGHVHVERNIPVRRPFRAPNFVRMGVTTLITGHCGTSVRDVAQMMEQLEKAGTQVNVASFVGHNTVREAVIGNATRPATAEEVAAMCRLVERDVSAGALGLSTGLAYAPGCFAREDEVIELARAAGRYGGMYAVHLRDEGLGGEVALEEALRVGRRARIAVHIAHFKLSSAAQWGRAGDRLARLERARQEGWRITLDAYAYTASSTSLDQLVPPDLRGNSPPWRQILSQPRRRQQAIHRVLVQLKEQGFPDFTFARIAYFYRDHSLEGLTIPQAAERLGLAKTAVAVPLPTQAETVLHLLARGGAQMIYFSMSEGDVKAILRHPLCSIGTDSAVRGNELRFMHPRGTGNFPKILGQYVREERFMPLAEALRKMTSLTAETFALTKRGRIRPGYAADLTLFDPAAVRDNSSYDKPLEPPSGIRYVFINGVAALEEGELTDTNAGQAIRRTTRIPATAATTPGDDTEPGRPAAQAAGPSEAPGPARRPPLRPETATRQRTPVATRPSRH